MSTANFDFDSLPDELILKIFGYLPFKDQVRQSGINRRFHQLSRTAIAQRKTLILDKNLMRYVMWNRPFCALLQECSPILEKIVSTDDDLTDWYWYPMAMKPIFQFSYPKLAEIKIERNFDDGHDGHVSVFDAEDVYDSFCLRMIEKCPNLRSLTLHIDLINVEPEDKDFQFRFPNNVKSTNLEKLNISKCDNKSFESMMGAVPKLKNLNIFCNDSDDDVLDKFFATTPVLEKFTLLCTEEFDLETYFWHLPLKSLELRFGDQYNQNVSDQLIKKISTSFPNLETLVLEDIGITDAAFRDICSLRALRYLDLSPRGEFRVESVEFLASCVKMEKFKLYGQSGGPQPVNLSLPRNVFVTIIQSCQKLNTILCDGVREVESADAVLQILSSFANVKRRIKIGVGFNVAATKIWKSDTVSAALQQLKENGGAEIEIFDRYRYLDDNEFMD